MHKKNKIKMQIKHMSAGMIYSKINNNIAISVCKLRFPFKHNQDSFFQINKEKHQHTSANMNEWIFTWTEQWKS